jgi:hypothetical protein
VIVKLGAGLGLDVQLLRSCAYPEAGALIGRLGRFSFAQALGSAESVARDEPEQPAAEPVLLGPGCSAGFAACSKPGTGFCAPAPAATPLPP